MYRILDTHGEFAEKHGIFRQQLRRLVKAKRVIPAPMVGRRKGKLVVLYEPNAVILPPGESEKKGPRAAILKKD